MYVPIVEPGAYVQTGVHEPPISARVSSPVRPVAVIVNTGAFEPYVIVLSSAVRITALGSTLTVITVTRSV